MKQQEAQSEKEVREDRALNEFGIGGLELGGSVWSLDRDKDGPWTLVRKGQKKPREVLQDRKFRKERELFHIAREEGEEQ